MSRNTILSGAIQYDRQFESEDLDLAQKFSKFRVTACHKLKFQEVWVPSSRNKSQVCSIVWYDAAGQVVGVAPIVNHRLSWFGKERYATLELLKYILGPHECLDLARANGGKFPFLKAMLLAEMKLFGNAEEP